MLVTGFDVGWTMNRPRRGCSRRSETTPRYRGTVAAAPAPAESQKFGDLSGQLRVRAAAKYLHSPNPVDNNPSPLRGRFIVWLGREDSNRRIRDPKSRALPLGHAPHVFPPGRCPRKEPPYATGICSGVA